MGYKKALPITKRSAFKQKHVPKGSNITDTSEESYLEESPSGQILNTTVLTTDYVKPGNEGLKNPGSPEFQKAFANARKQGLSEFEFGGGVYTTELASPPSPDVPGSTKDITQKPLTVDVPGQPKKTGDAFYAFERRKSIRDAKIIKNKMIQDLKRKKRKGNLGDLNFDTEVQKIEDQYTKNLQSISDMGGKQFKQGINPRTGRSVTTQEQIDASTRPMTKKDLTPEQLAKLKTTSNNTSNDTSKSLTNLATSFAIGGANAVSNIMKERDKKAVEDFNKAIPGGFPMKSGFKMKGYGSKNKK